MIFRTAVRADLPAVLALIVDDQLGSGRDSTVVDADYERAFADITADPRNELIVAEDAGEVIGCMQITYIPGLSRHGAERSLIEAVRVRADRRGGGIGRQFFTWAIDRARDRGCALVQLTTDKSRGGANSPVPQDEPRTSGGAINFYLSLGFSNSHEGMKLQLRPNHFSKVPSPPGHSLASRQG